MVYQSGVGEVPPAVFAYTANHAGSTFVWKLRAQNGSLWSESQLLVEVIAAPRLPTNGTIEAELGDILPPFFALDGAVGQALQTSASEGGSAAYSFNVDRAGDYLIRARVNAPFFQQRSVSVNVDAEPLDEYMVWPIPITAGFQEHTVSWIGTGVCIRPQFEPKVFRLEGGTHRLFVRGRDPNVRLDRFSVILILPEVLTLEATNGLGSSVVVSGQINPLGTVTRAYFEYGLTPDYGATTTLTNVGSGGDPVELHTRLSGLLPGAVYHYRLVAYNGNGTNFGADRLFVSGAPRVRSPTLQQGQFSLKVTTVSNWVYFLQRRSALNAAAWQAVTNRLGDGTVQTLSDPAPIPGHCFYRIEAGPLPGVQFGSATLLADGMVMLSGVAHPYGLPASAWFEYGLTTNHGQRTASWQLLPNQGQTAISNLLTGLEGESIYYFRLMASNANGIRVSQPHALITSGPTITATTLEDGVFSARIPTSLDRRYHLEFTTNLSNPHWLALTSFVGDGALRTLVDPLRDDSSRFYRVRVELLRH